MFVFAVNMSVCVVGRPLFTAQSGQTPPPHPHDPTNSVSPPLSPDIIEGEEELPQKRVPEPSLWAALSWRQML